MMKIVGEELKRLGDDIQCKCTLLTKENNRVGAKDRDAEVAFGFLESKDG